MKLDKFINTKYFRTLEIDQTYIAYWKKFIQEKQLNLNKDNRNTWLLTWGSTNLQAPDPFFESSTSAG